MCPVVEASRKPTDMFVHTTCQELQVHQTESQGKWGQVKYLCSALYGETPTKILTFRKLRQEDYYFKSSLGYIGMLCSPKQTDKNNKQTNEQQPTTSPPPPHLCSSSLQKSLHPWGRHRGGSLKEQMQSFPGPSCRHISTHPISAAPMPHD